MKTFDVIVLGVGGVGSAAALHLADRGLRVLGLDRFEPGHDRGSSHGQTRIIRKAYFEHPDYVPLLERAYQLWADLESRCGRQLYFPVGVLEVGPADGIVIPGVLESAHRHQLPIDEISEAELTARFPGFILPAGHRGVFERDAGYLLVEDCVRAHADLGLQRGVELRCDQAVLSWEASANSVEVRTSADIYSASSLVVASGAWSAGLLADLSLALRVLRKHLHWYKCAPGEYDGLAGCPGFFYELDGAFFYGFPAIDERGVKVAEHSGGEEIVNPIEADRNVDRADQLRVESFLRQCMPDVSQTPTDHAVCFYTVSPDEHFIVDRHPLHSNVAFAAGLSGHGFKFTSVLGEILAELVTDQRSAQPIEFLSCRRFAS